MVKILLKANEQVYVKCCHLHKLLKEWEQRVKRFKVR